MLVLASNVCLAPLAEAVAAGSTVQLSAKKPTMEIGKDAVVAVLVQNAPTIYGADVCVVFDPRILEVVDADHKVTGVQIEPGRFLDPKGSFALQHQVDNQAGRVDYALTLVRPAPAVSGDGQLAQITFRGKAAGTARVSLQQGQFGTRTGEVVSPGLGTLELTVVDREGGRGERSFEAVRRAATGMASATVPVGSVGRLWLVGSAAGAGVLLGWLLLRRGRRA